jgi:transcriptional regulator with XRE-family HTH domain
MTVKASLQERVARRIREMRIARGLTQDAVATRLEIALKNYQRVESGRQNLTLSTVERVALSLGVEPVDLFVREAREMAVRGSPRHARTDWASSLIDAGFELVEEGAARAVRVLSLEAAAGLAKHGNDVEALSFARLPGKRRVQDASRHFVARVVGASMEPDIADGSWALFRTPVSLPLSRRVLLIAIRDDAGERYVLKRVREMSRRKGRTSAVLESSNAAFEPMHVETSDPHGIVPIAEVVAVY